MFTANAHVVFVGKGFLALGQSIDEVIAKEKSGEVLEWQANSLETSLTTLLSDQKPGKIDLLLGEGTVYLLNLSLPDATQSKEEISEKLQMHLRDKVPEEFGEKEWGCEQVAQDNSATTYALFTPQQELFQKVVKTIGALGFELNSFLPVELVDAQGSQDKNRLQHEMSGFAVASAKNSQISRLVLAAILAGAGTAAAVLYLLIQN